MRALDILKLLLTYRSMIQSELDDAGIRSDGESTEISSAYSFVTLDIRAGEGELSYRMRFELNTHGARLVETYCQDKGFTDVLQSKLAQKKFPGFEEKLSVKNFPWSDEVRNSIEQADEIAALCVNCTAGDDYRPGNFSKITIYHDRIELEQINKMNAKSLDHKKNYSLRSLEFVIPLSKDIQPSLAQYKIGDMLIEFSDSSSENNRQYGDKVREELDRLAEQL